MGFLVATMLLALAAPAMAEENNNEVSLRATGSNQLLKQTSTDTCISVPAQCPYYPSNQLNQCFSGNTGVVSNCQQLCKDIFTGNQYSGNIIPACEIGCSYAAKYWGTAAELPVHRVGLQAGPDQVQLQQRPWHQRARAPELWRWQGLPHWLRHWQPRRGPRPVSRVIYER